MAMLSRAEIYQNNAAECEREGDLATIPALKNKYRGVAQQWREMAEEAKRSTVKRTKARSWAAGGKLTGARRLQLFRRQGCPRLGSSFQSTVRTQTPAAFACFTMFAVR